MLKVEEVLDNYKVSMRKITLLQTRLEYLEKVVVLKTTNYCDDVGGGKRKTMYDKYEKMLEEKEEVKYAIATEELKIATVNKTLELLYDTHPIECNVLRLRYLKNKTIPYISQEVGYSEPGVNKKIKSGKLEFAKIYELIA